MEIDHPKIPEIPGKNLRRTGEFVKHFFTFLSTSMGNGRHARENERTQQVGSEWEDWGDVSK
jgi:hypothetical protein